MQSVSNREPQSQQGETHDLKELALHLVLPAFSLELVGDTEDLLYSTRDHTGGRLGLRNNQHLTRQ